MASKNASAEFMREARKERGLSMKDAAQLIGVNVATLRRYERDGLTRHMRASRGFRIAKVYDTSLEYLDLLIRSNDGGFLWTRRKELGLSGVDMAERLGCSVGTLIELEYDGIDGSTSEEELRNICIAYRVSSDDLLARMS